MRLPFKEHSEGENPRVQTQQTQTDKLKTLSDNPHKKPPTLCQDLGTMIVLKLLLTQIFYLKFRNMTTSSLTDTCSSCLRVSTYVHRSVGMSQAKTISSLENLLLTIVMFLTKLILIRDPGHLAFCVWFDL